MPCETVVLPGGQRAIVCTGRRKVKPCGCGCGRAGTQECDWIVSRPEGKPAKTCDRPICSSCSTSPAAGKDLCPEHTEAWKAWLSNRAAAK